MARWMRKEGKFCKQKEMDGGRSEEAYWQNEKRGQMKEEGMRTLKEEGTKRLDEGRLPNVLKKHFS